MKVIDVYQKISRHDDDFPKDIEHRGDLYTFDEKSNDYINSYGDYLFDKINIMKLNDEIEIITLNELENDGDNGTDKETEITNELNPDITSKYGIGKLTSYKKPFLKFNKKPDIRFKLIIDRLNSLINAIDYLQEYIDYLEDRNEKKVKEMLENNRKMESEE